MNNKLIKEGIYIGIFTVFIGFLTEYILTKFNKKDNFLSKLKENKQLFILYLFIFGILLHLFLEYSGFEAYCEKKCNSDGVCNYVCTVKVNA